MPVRRDIALVVTGSVAAVKSFLLLRALEAAGFSPHVAVTDAAWPFLRSDGKYRAAPGELAALEARSAGDIGEKIEKAESVLIAPCSADFIRQVALQDTQAGGLIKNCGKPVFFAPAMNFMMWNHPATQGHVKTLLGMGMKMLGPAFGDMACGDHGYGRMIEPADIARAAAEGKDAAETGALVDAPLMPRTVRGACRKILLVVHDEDGGTLRRVVAWRERGVDVQCVVTDEAKALLDVAALERMTGHAVVGDHYQLYPKDGMEHIWLAEDADAVVMLPASGKYLREMAKGAAESFNGCLYLASKRPVIVVPGADCGAEDLRAVAAHGAFIAEEAGIFGLVKSIEREGAPDFAGKRFLVLGGNPREAVDSFRFYVNTARDAAHGARVAAEIESRGGKAELIVAEGTARELLGRALALKGGAFDGILQLAGISQFACPRPAAHKISKTGADRAPLFEVEGNVDVLGGLRAAFGAGKVMGFDNYQQWHGGDGAPLCHKLASLVRRTRGLRTCA